jgi:hypothetical protein
MSGIFISYRRQDSQSAAGRLTDFLEREFGTAQIFRDVETIEPGVDFADAIERALSSCKVVLTLIGPRWLTMTDARGQRRLDNPNDWIRLETAKALKRNIRVIPLLVEGASPPAEADLPEDLRPLARREAHELSDKRWDDVQQLAAILERILGIRRKSILVDGEKNSAQVKGRSSKLVKALAWVGGIWVGGIVLVLILFAVFQESSVPPVIPQPVLPIAGGLSGGTPTSACGCWGYVAPGDTRPNPQCASGHDTPRVCPGWCPAGGSPWQSVCM